jgi:hypothetical protein
VSLVVVVVVVCGVGGKLWVVGAVGAVICLIYNCIVHHCSLLYQMMNDRMADKKHPTSIIEIDNR